MDNLNTCENKPDTLNKTSQIRNQKTNYKVLWDEGKQKHNTLKIMGGN